MVNDCQKIAALVCMDIDTLLVAAENRPADALEFFRLLKNKKDDMINNEILRDTRYAAVCNLSSITTNQRKDNE